MKWVIKASVFVLVAVMAGTLSAQWRTHGRQQDFLRFDRNSPFISVSEWTDPRTRERYLVFAGPTGIAVAPPTHPGDRVIPGPLWNPGDRGIGEAAPLTEPDPGPDSDESR